MFYKKAVLKIYIIHRKTPLLELLFNKVAGLKNWNFIKMRLQHRCFPVSNAQLFRTPTLKIPTLKNICEILLLKGWYWFSINEILKFYHRDIMGISPFAFRWLFLLGFFCKTINYFTRKCIYLRNKCCKYCCRF